MRGVEDFVAFWEKVCDLEQMCPAEFERAEKLLKAELDAARSRSREKFSRTDLTQCGRREKFSR
jgi:hypothetical protein